MRNKPEIAYTFLLMMITTDVLYIVPNGKLFILRCLVAWSEPAYRIKIYNFYLTFLFFYFIFIFRSGYTKPGRQVSLVTTFFTVALNIFVVLNYELIYQLDAVEYLFVYYQLDMFRAYTPIFRSNGCYNLFTYTAYGVLGVVRCRS